MANLNLIPKKIVKNSHKTIEKIIVFYEKLSLPAYILISAGQYKRTEVIPCEDTREGWLSNSIVGTSLEEWFETMLNPYRICSDIHGEKSFHSQKLKELPVKSALIVIDYSFQRKNIVFEPIVVAMDYTGTV